MSQYEYRVVPFVGQLKRGVFNVENANKVSEQLQDVINKHSKQGWEFYCVDKIDIQVNPGCLAALFGAKVSVISFDQVIFRRLVEQAE